MWGQGSADVEAWGAVRSRGCGTGERCGPEARGNREHTEEAGVGLSSARWRVEARRGVPNDTQILGLETIPKVRTWRRGRGGEDVGACWVCSASMTSGEMVRDGRALGSELRGGMGKAAVAHRPHNQDRLTVGAEAASC